MHDFQQRNQLQQRHPIADLKVSVHHNPQASRPAIMMNTQKKPAERSEKASSKTPCYARNTLPHVSIRKFSTSKSVSVPIFSIVRNTINQPKHCDGHTHMRKWYRAKSAKCCVGKYATGKIAGGIARMSAHETSKEMRVDTCAIL
jgi:hypothetical protein